MTLEQRIQAALDIATQYGGIDGDHHKAWVIDQMVRALTDCLMEQREAVDAKGAPYTYETMGESDEYKTFVANAMDGEDGPETYFWETGIPP